MALNVVEKEFWYFVLFKFNLCTLKFTWFAAILADKVFKRFWVVEKKG